MRTEAVILMDTESGEELERLIHEKNCRALERRNRLSGKQAKE